MFWPVINASLWDQSVEYMRIYARVRLTQLPNFMEARQPVPSGLHIPVWRQLLTDYPDMSLVDLLEYGWPLDYTSTRIHIPTLKNHLVAADSDFHIIKLISKELQHGAFLGPFLSLLSFHGHK